MGAGSKKTGRVPLRACRSRHESSLASRKHANPPFVGTDSYLSTDSRRRDFSLRKLGQRKQASATWGRNEG